MQLREVTFQRFEEEAQELGITLPIEQTQAWAKLEGTIEGRSQWGCFRITDDLGTDGEKTVALIAREAERCNYTPSLLAKGLRTSRTDTLGLLIPSIDNPYFAHIASIIVHEARAKGYKVILIDTSEDERNEREGVRSLLSRKVDGILIAPAGDDPAFLEATARQTPVVCIDRHFAKTSLPYVVTDNLRGGREATQHLIDRGHRELPIRAGEIGLVHRHELRGALHGLFRVRCFNQDDAHLFVRPDQLTDEIVGVVNLIDSVYQKFGFKYHVELSTRPEDSMGSDEDWARAEEGLRTALEQLGMDYEVNEGDGAFYGPKIDFHLEDSLGRTWQCGTVQLDFQMPLNFNLEYVDADGSKKRPIMLHRVCFGSIERFIGILTEHYAGAFPLWLAPVQVKVMPITDRTNNYAKHVADRLEKAGLRVETDLRNEKIGYKIREAQSQKIPYMLVLGDKEAENDTISVRTLSGEQSVESLADFIARLQADVKSRKS